MKDDQGTLRGLCLGGALALLLILGINALGYWDQRHRGAVADPVLWGALG
jgi:hypothetical protein